MRTIPAAVETLLKSRAQAGANAHNHLITLTGAPSAYSGSTDWLTMRDMRTGLAQGGHFVTRSDGKILVTYHKQDPVTEYWNTYLSVVDTEDDIFYSDDESAANEVLFLENTQADGSIGLHWSTLYKLANGQILLFIHRWGDSTDLNKPQKVLCYVSENGLGTDFAYLSDVVSCAFGGGYNFNEGEVGVGKAVQLPSGRILLPHSYWGSYFGAAANYMCVSYSDNNGATWTSVPTNKSVNATPIRTIAVFGSQLVISDGNWAGQGSHRFFVSNNEGGSWTAVSETYTLKATADRLGAAVAWGEGDGYNYYYFNGEDTPGGMNIFRRADTEPLPTTGQDPYDIENTWELVGPAGGIGVNFFTDYLLWITGANQFALAGTRFDHITDDTVSSIYGGIREAITLRAKRIEINRNKGMASSATVVFDNKGGIYSPDKEVGHPWKNVMFPNNGIKIEQGYGSNLITTFTGTIDDVVMTTFPAEITLVCRDYLKRAYDQLITSGGTHSITYNNFTPEAMFTALAGLAGWAAGDIHTEVTGLTIAEKIFTNETYGDAFSWLADMCGFMVFCDEDGDIYYVKDDDDAVPSSDYAFAEGEDIISLGYTISDRDLYSKIICIGDGVSYEVTYYNTYNILAAKKMIINASEATTEAQCQAIAEQARYVMNARARICEFAGIANPYLQIGDTLTVTETTTLISELYKITDISTVQSPDGYIAQITAYHYAAPAES